SPDDGRPVNALGINGVTNVSYSFSVDTSMPFNGPVPCLCGGTIIADPHAQLTDGFIINTP
ncbi:MAG: hypothetical protein ACREM8_01665, partial [Vulcanimicrobiaceae bacterium]